MTRKWQNRDVARTAAIGLLALFMGVSVVKAESDSSEKDRLDRIARMNGGSPLVSGTSASSKPAYKGGGAPAVTQTEVFTDQAQIPMLTARGDADLLKAQNVYSNIVAQGGFPKVSGSNYKKGSEGAGVAALNKRLFVEGYLRAEATQGQFAAIFTSATEDAVKRYQRNLGLAVSGKADAATIAELNVSADVRLRTISVNIPRLAVYQQGLGDRYLMVNIPAQQLESVNGGHVYSRQNVIVGRPERPTPVVMTPLATVKFNPYWNAPVSIVERDIIPKMKSGPQVLQAMNMKVFKGIGGPEVDPKSIDWSRAIPDDYQFRQEPGPENAMKTAKIEFVSPFGIYLHDTPEPQLFKTSNRFYSSGCIRVENMPLLVRWVLNGQDGFNEGKIASMATTLERLDVPIAAPPQLRVGYLTAWPTSNGTVAFRRDIYDMDKSGFTVGQPMPVGEKSPDGQRYVLKPLPRQIPVDAAEAEGFNLFGFRSTRPSSSSTFARPGIATRPFFAATKVSTNAMPVQALKKPSPTGFTKTAGQGKPGSGLFDWAAYRKQQMADARTPQIKKKIKALTKLDPKSVKLPKKGKIAVAMADPCAANAAGKVPKECLPPVKK